MRKIVIFEKYELNENGVITNINTNKQIKIDEKNGNKFAKLYINGKTKRINVTEMLTENFPPIVEEKVTKQKASKKYIIRVTQLDGEVLEFKTFKAANDHYGLRKDYLNYCITEPYFYMLTKNGLQLKAVEKVSLV